MPDSLRETELLRRGAGFVIGLDEVGVGALAGPVVAGAVAFPCWAHFFGDPDLFGEIEDSKKLTPVKREALSPKIMDAAAAWAVSGVGPEGIDRLNIFRARIRAMMSAFTACQKQLGVEPVGVIVDGANLARFMRFPNHIAVFENHADATSVSVAAASIIAKVARDHYMTALDAFYPCYKWRSNMGYGTPDHLKRLEENGPCSQHRYSFRPVDKCAEKTYLDVNNMWR